MPTELVSLIKEITVENDPTASLSRFLAQRSRAEKSRLLLQFFDFAVTTDEQLLQAVNVAWTYFLDESLWDETAPTLENFRQTYHYAPQVQELADRAGRAAIRAAETIDGIVANWGPLDQLFPGALNPPRPAYNFSLLLARLTRMTTRENAVELITQAVTNRMERDRGKTVSSPPHVLNRDLTAVIDQLETITVTSKPETTEATARSQTPQLLQLAAPEPVRASSVMRRTPSRQSIQVVVPPQRSAALVRRQTPRIPEPDSSDSPDGSPEQEDEPLAPNPTCGCAPELLRKLAYLRTNPQLAERLETFKYGVEAGLESFCWNHIRSYFSLSVALMSNTTRGRNEFEHRITTLYATLELTNDDYPTFVNRPAYIGWFNATARPVRPSDAWRPYRYPTATIPEPDVNPVHIFSWFTGNPDAYSEFLSSGNIIVPGFFSFLNTPEIQTFADVEFKVYRYHFRENDGKPSMGFLRNCYYGILQQAFRMDPGYYLMNVAARPSHQTKLISYPYVAKETFVGESTGFLHMDINLDKYFSSQLGRNQLTSSVSLDDEDDQNCTVLVPGFMKHAQAWNELVKTRLRVNELTGYRTDAKKHYTVQDQEAFGRPQPFPCPPFGIRVTLPTVIHGSTPSASKRRRVIYPWFTAIHEDGETLEMPGQATWSQLSACHRDLEAPKSGVAGEVLTEDRPPYRFPAAVKLASVSPLSDALVGRRRWTDSEVLKERAILFSDTPAAKALLREIRQKLTTAVLDAYSKFEETERHAFGECSFFLNDGVRPGTPNVEEGPEEMLVD